MPDTTQAAQSEADQARQALVEWPRRKAINLMDALGASLMTSGKAESAAAAKPPKRRLGRITKWVSVRQSTYHPCIPSRDHKVPSGPFPMWISVPS
jgi:hypothetical protein